MCGTQQARPDTYQHMQTAAASVHTGQQVTNMRNMDHQGDPACSQHTQQRSQTVAV